MLSAGMSRNLSAASRSYFRGAATQGYGRDPNLLVHLDPWPLVLSEPQRSAASAVLDVILPGEGDAPVASAVNLVDFLDEWVSAPYQEQREDAAQVLPLLRDMDNMAMDRYGVTVDRSSLAQRVDLVAAFAATPAHDEAFRRLCVLAAAGYYTSAAGIKAIGFIGNEPRLTFDGPPGTVLQGFEDAFAALGSG